MEHIAMEITSLFTSRIPKGAIFTKQWWLTGSFTEILLALLKQKISDRHTFSLLEEIVDSFSPGIPLGNLTSQVFANIYLNELDQFIKQNLRVKYYLRYAENWNLGLDRKILIRAYSLI